MPPDRPSAGSGCAPSPRASARSGASGSIPTAGAGHRPGPHGDREGAARDLGLATLRLSTGGRQPEAVALYRSTGWEEVPIEGGADYFRFAKALS